jgi:hypothetical protein
MRCCGLYVDLTIASLLLSVTASIPRALLATEIQAYFSNACA